MQSIFDDDEELYGYAAQLGMPITRRVQVRSITTDLSYRERTSSTKRTVPEALARARVASGPVNTARQIPFLTPYTYLFTGVALGLILIDPLNRLEGGLID